MECECKKGYGGMLWRHWQVDMSTDLPVVPQNNPNPLRERRSPASTKTPGYTGFHCEKELNDWQTDWLLRQRRHLPIELEWQKSRSDLPHSNALTTATPIDSSDTTRCHCRPGFTGRRCQFNITGARETLPGSRPVPGPAGQSWGRLRLRLRCWLVRGEMISESQE
uniref:EGF-like domain-containing protein n=1 Tax=Macrostomum lignano TaxID=282301 RepID=A0A1I8JQZ2_9PLAT